MCSICQCDRAGESPPAVPGVSGGDRKSYKTAYIPRLGMSGIARKTWARTSSGLAGAYLLASFTFDTSQSLMVLSVLPEASVCPSGENATDLMRLRSLASVRSGWPLETSQSLMVSSQLPENSIRPSGENARDETFPVWPVSVRSSWPLATSQSLMVLSKLPEASVRPSGRNATEATSLIWPVNVRSKSGAGRTAGAGGN